MQELKVKSTYCSKNKRFGEVSYYQFIATQVFNQYMSMILHANLLAWARRIYLLHWY